MKTSISTILSTLLILIFGCKKYEDGPFISLRTKKARLVGEWELTNKDEYINNEKEAYHEILNRYPDLTADIISFEADLSMEFEQDDEYSIKKEGSITYKYIDNDLNDNSYWIEEEESRERSLEVEEKGNWNWEDKKGSIELEPTAMKYPMYTETENLEGDYEYKILKLTNKELILENEDGNKLTFVKK